MKKFVVLIVCALFAAVFAVDNTALEASKKRFKDARTGCQSETATAVDETELETYKTSNGPKPANLGPHALCVSKKMGWQNEDGTINRNLIETRLVSIYGDSEDLRKTITEWVVPKETAEATAMHLITKYRQKIPKE